MNSRVDETECLRRRLEEAETRAEAAEDALQRFRRSFEECPGGYTKINREGRILEADPAFCGIAGHTPDGLYLLAGSTDTCKREEAGPSARKEQDRLRFVIEGSRLGTWEWDTNTGETVFNPEWAGMLGYSLEDLAPVSIQTWKDLTHPNDLENTEQKLADCLAGRIDFYECELRLRHRDGRWIWVLNRGTVIERNADGSPRLMFGTQTNIDALKRAESRLSEQESRFRMLYDNMTSGVAIYEAVRDGEDFLIVDVNRAGLELSRKRLEDIAGEPVTRVFPAVKRIGLFDVFQRVWRTGKPERLPLVLYDDGETREWVENIVFKLPSGDIVAIYEDTTEQRRQEEAVRATEAKFRALFEKSPIGVAHHRMIYDETGKPVDYLFLDANRNYQYLTGVDPRGMRVTEAFPGIDKDPFDWIGTFTRAARDGDTLRFRQHLQPNNRVYDVVGFQTEPDHFVTAFIEVTEQIRLEEQLAQSQKMESIGRLAGGVAHDFNNMLNVILGHAEIVLDTLSPHSRHRSDLEEIRRAAVRSADLTGQLLAFARRQPVTPRVLDLNETIESMSKMIRRVTDEGVEVCWIPGDRVGPIGIDPAQISQILVNLVVNARDAIDGTGRITILTGEADAARTNTGETVPGGFAVLEVRDNGTGIEASILPHIFEPFFTTKPTGDGTGLGLSTVYGIVKQNRGYIDVESDPGNGTSFRIYLPLCGESRGGSALDEADTPETETGEETVLLVEDEASVLKLSRMMLEHMGYTVLAAASPKEAMAVAHDRRDPIDLFITDVIMPQMNGRELSEKLKEHHPEMKLLYTSGYTANVIGPSGVLRQSVHFLQKPFSMKDLGRAAREALAE